MELIYKDALLKELGITNENCEKCAWGDGYGYCTRDSDFTDACDAICTAPIIEERKTGKWIRNVDDDINAWWYECSECGDYPLKNEYGHDELSQWCPHCGAKMEGEEDG